MKKTVATLFALAATTAAVAAPASTGTLRTTAAHAAIVDACPGGNPTCLENGVDAFTQQLGARADATPSGRAGLAGWLRIAADVRDGSVATVATSATLSLPDAIRAVYAATGITVDAGLDRAIVQQATALRPAEASQLADLLSAFALAYRLAHDASIDSGLNGIDPKRAMRLTTFVGSAPPGSVPAALEREWRRVRAAIEAVDIPTMAAASLMLADAIARFDLQHISAPIDLPYIIVGAEGDTVHDVERNVSIDMSGSDTYTNNAGGSFLFAGSALALDLGDGDDTYTYGAGAQGWGLGGIGIMYDEGGTDRYSLSQFGQGSNVGGIGVLYDVGAGDDRYLSPHEGEPVGVKAASLGGVGLVVDEGGSDVFHQDGVDGLIWAGIVGHGILASLGDGDDRYIAHGVEIIDPLCTAEECPSIGTFAGPIQVSAEVNATTILYEEGGDDSYTCGEAVRQGCQGAAGIGSLSLLWDRAGSDTYWMGESASDDLIDAVWIALYGEEEDGTYPFEHPVFPMGQGAAYGFGAPATIPTAIGALIDDDGVDSYTAEKWAQGYGTFNGFGILRDAGSDDDTYDTRAPMVGARTDASNWLDGFWGIGLDE